MYCNCVSDINNFGEVILFKQLSFEIHKIFQLNVMDLFRTLFIQPCSVILKASLLNFLNILKEFLNKSHIKFFINGVFS